jgi:DNA-directed RNA polymerase sigma subunit (sigma70/sigma32)
MTLSPENKERLRIGAAIANKLTPLKSPVEVAAQLGISTTRLRQIECLSLWKISQRLKQLTGRELGPGDFESDGILKPARPTDIPRQ